MVQLDAMCVEEVADVTRKWRPLAAVLRRLLPRDPSLRVERIADEWVAGICHVDADLVRPSGGDLHLLADGSVV